MLLRSGGAEQLWQINYVCLTASNIERLLTVDIRKLLRIAPRRRAWRRLRLCIRVKEHNISRDSLILKLLCDILWFAQEIARHVFYSRTLFCCQKIHHFLWRRPSRSSPHLRPALRALEEHTHGVKARDTIRTGHDCCQALEIWREGWKIIVDALLLDWQALRTHGGGQSTLLALCCLRRACLRYRQ